jgi:transcriptional regulator with PAS, ATPase and Fis domain
MTLPSSVGHDDSFAHIVGCSEELARAVQTARLLAEVDSPVLLQGETGVGKEVFARALHDGGRCARGPFVAVNCGGLPRDLLASELFGYVDGAFTGARRGGMAGKIEAAHGGTLFLDEIGEMPLELQPYLLRVLDGGEVYPLGSNKPRSVCFRLTAASNRDLRTEVTAGRFRSDLFYRVSVTSLLIPALRDRVDDLPALVEHFAAAATAHHQVRRKSFSAAVLSAFARYRWPGNLRELRNVVEAMILLGAGDILGLADLPSELVMALEGAEHDDPAPGAGGLECLEREAIGTAVRLHRGNLARVARELQIAKSTLYLKMKKYSLEPILEEVRLCRGKGGRGPMADVLEKGAL